MITDFDWSAGVARTIGFQLLHAHDLFSGGHQVVRASQMYVLQMQTEPSFHNAHWYLDCKRSYMYMHSPASAD